MFRTWQSRLVLVLVVLGYLASLAGAFSLDWRQGLQKHFRLDRKILLSTVSGDLFGDGSAVKVLKFRAPEGIVLEFLGPMDTGSRPLLDRIVFENHLDAYFDIGGEASRLAVVDLDGDQRLELIAPTVDPGLRNRLNALHFNSSTKKFEPIQ